MAKDSPRAVYYGKGFREGWKGKPMPDGQKFVPPSEPAANVPRPKPSEDSRVEDQNKK